MTDATLPAVAFDLDGTLIDSAPEIRRVANAVLALRDLPPLTLEKTRSFVGHGLPMFVTQMLEANGLAPDAADIAATTAEMERRYIDSHELTVLYPGADEALEVLRRAGHPLAVCTNKPEGPARAVLDHFGLTDLFPVVIGGDTLPRRKPDPLPLLETARRLGAQRLVFVGDSEVDAETARAAGLPFALFTGGYRKSPVEEIPHAARFDRFADLPGLVATLTAARA